MGDGNSDSGGGRRVQIVNPLNRVTVDNLVTLDDQGIPSDPLNTKLDQRVILQSTVGNEQSRQQPFVFIVQITDSEGYTQAIEIVTGILDPHQSTDVEVSLVSTNEGRFSAQIFCWNGLENAEPLSSVRSIELFVARTTV